LLQTYSEERQQVAQTLIDFDRDFSKVFSMKPKSKENPEGVDPVEFQKYFQLSGRFTAGVATQYQQSMITGSDDFQDLAKGQIIGKRFHSAQVIRHADAKPFQLGHCITANGAWRIFAFAGKAKPMSYECGILKLAELLSLSKQSPLNRFTPKDSEIDSVIDFRFVFQSPHLSVFDNISFGLRAKKLPKSEIQQRTLEAAGILGLTDLLARRPGELSGGQKQRVAMGRAIVRKPKVFFFDEPLSNLDAKLRHKMRAEMKKLHQQVRTTTIYVTHDQVEAMTLADRIVIMKDGHIEQVGSPDEVYQRPQSQFVAGFIGSPSMNFAAGVLEGNSEAKRLITPSGGSIELGTCPYPAGTKVELGFRPEHMEVAEKADHNQEQISINAQISVVEPMGHETILTCETAFGEITGKYTGARKLSPTQLVHFHVNKEKLHYFDAQTGKRLEVPSV
jgi:ABC-type sugar transport system ATPase subunit